MKEDVIYKVAADLLLTIEKEARPASEIINAFTRLHKSFGSKDRRLLTDTVWNVIRHKARLDYLYPNKTYLEKIEILNKGALPIDERTPFHVQVETPQWLIQKIKNADKELPALLENPSIILRATKDRDFVQKELLKEGVETEKTTLSPYGLILKKRTNLQGLIAYKTGLIEVQDEASQLVALETKISSQDCVLDYCAGAGGKSLIFAQMMNQKGHILAHDISKRSLEELQKRAQRGNISIIDTTLDIPAFLKQHPKIKFSHVVVDAPCSGTGTWRRCPDARWKLTENQFNDLLKKQASILKKAASFTPLNAYLIYMTCSITEDENINQVQKFLKSHPAFKLKGHKQFSPARTNTDGLFVAIMKKEFEHQKQ